jgi:succinate-semialdehyde dehydrogenase/glutarate-semialdehyde dehydrogenase
VGKILLKQSASTVKKLSLELGGNAPFIVFEDADIETAVTSLITSKFKVSGQTCVCANRIYVQDAIHDTFVERLVAAVEAFKVGPASDPANTHGPLIHGNAVEKSQSHVKDAISKGASSLTGYPTSESQGMLLLISSYNLSNSKIPGSNFFPPTVLINANKTMRIAKEETFGPVAAIFRFYTESEVVTAANEAEVGLASYIMTRDHDRARRVSEALEVGMVAINTGVISNAAAP